MNILFVGDIVGKPGRKAVKELLPSIMKEFAISFTVANAENAAGGRGLNRDVLEELLSLEIDVLTMGNHVWDNKDIFNFVDDEVRLIRPINFPPHCPGQGYHIFTTGINQKVAVINAMGRVFMSPLDCPFRAVEQVLDEIKDQADVILVDLHAEATSEKLAFAHYFAGRVSAVLGTHTHVQTSDERILGGKTAYITDLGMTGPQDSILGMEKEMVIQKIIYQRPVRLEVAKGPLQFEGVVITLDDNNGIATGIYRISRHL